MSFTSTDPYAYRALPLSWRRTVIVCAAGLLAGVALAVSTERAAAETESRDDLTRRLEQNQQTLESERTREGRLASSVDLLAAERE
ncbi:MAG: hypothetical protein AAFV26_05970, partial [Pseudomonadota bacterium]